MSQPTEREWLEGLRPEDEREVYNRAPRPEHSEVVAALDWWVSWRGTPESVSIPDIATLASAARVHAHDTESDARRTEEGLEDQAARSGLTHDDGWEERPW